MKARTPATNRRASWREHFLEIARKAGEPLPEARPAAPAGVRARLRPGLVTFARRRPAALALPA